MTIPNHFNCIYNTYVLLTKKRRCIIIKKLCPIVRIFISEFYNNLKIMSKVVEIIVFKNRDTLK